MRSSIIIPVVRKHKIKKLVKLIKKRAGVPESDYEIIWEEDKKRIGAPKMVKKLAKRANFETVMFIGDDTIPGGKFLKLAQIDMLLCKDGWGLVGLNDTTGRVGLATHWLADNRLLPILGGEFFHTGYRHCCCDVELTERCNEVGKFVYSMKSCVYHDHPLLKGEKIKDPDYERVYSKEWLEHDRALLKKRRENGWKNYD